MTETLTDPMTTGMTSTGSTAADVAIATLEAHGVETVFGVPGVHTLALYDALTRSSIRHILARHEQGAGFMADGYARATGRTGVAVIITGPGITNVATPVGEAYADSSPVFVLSANVERPYLDAMRGSLHDLKDQLGVMAAVTSWNTRVMNAADTSSAVGEALHRAASGRRLPVHVEVPLDVLDEVVEYTAVESDRLPGRIVPDPMALAEASTRLKSASKTVIYCGGGAVSAAAGEHVIALAERLGAPVVTSIMGKGTVPEDHPLVLGALWSPGNAIDTLLRETDCMVVFGSKLGVQATNQFKLPLPAELIRFDVDEAELSLNARPTVSILGDAALAAEGIVSLLAGDDYSAGGFEIERITAARKEARSSAFGSDRLPYIDALRRAMPRDGILAFDMTMMSYASCYLYPAYLPRTFLFPSGYGTLGFAFPAALGAKVGRPDTAVACVVGDGGFQYTMEELGTAVQHRIGVPIVIFNDSTYSAVKDEQASNRGGRFIGVDLINPDYLKIADAYGIPGVRAENPEALERAMREAMDRDLPSIIDVPIEPWI
jgi:acetolactate synthase-1/2/3 large subunit